MKLYGLVHWGDDDLEDCRLFRVYRDRAEAETAASALRERQHDGTFHVMELELETT